MNDTKPQVAPKPQQAPQIVLQKIYLKDASFEAPMGIKAFEQNWKPQLNQQLQTKNMPIKDDLHEVVLTITLSALLNPKESGDKNNSESEERERSSEESKTAFIVEVQQAGIFMLKATDIEQKTQMINENCPNILFPYAREALDNLIIKAGFPAVNLPPVNFHALHQQALQQQQKPEVAH